MAQPKSTPSVSEHTLTIANPKPRGSNVVDLERERARRKGGSPRPYTPWQMEEPLDYENGDIREEPEDIFSPEQSTLKNEAILYEQQVASVLETENTLRYSQLPKMPRVPPPPPPPKKKYRIGKVTSAIMTLIALTLDLAIVLMLIGGLGLFAMGIDAVKTQCSGWSMVENALTCTALVAGVTAGAFAGMASLAFVGPAIVFIVGLLTNAIAVIIFGPWFFFLGVSPFSSAKKAASLLINILAEIMSAGILPSITLAVVLTIHFTHHEDKEKYKKALGEYEKEKKEYNKKYASLIVQRKKYADFLNAQRQMAQAPFARAA